MGLIDGKSAIVTGGGNGIGRAVAITLAREGARVLVNDLGCQRDGTHRDPAVAELVAESIVADGGVALASCQDVATRAGAEQMVALALSAWNQVDILINTTGVTRDKALSKVDDEDWEAVMGAGLRAVLYCTQAVAGPMKVRGGRIVNTTGSSGFLGNFGQVVTATANAGVYGLTRTAAIELQRYGITVNAVAPLAKTRLTADLPLFDSTTSLTPEHVVPAYVFFASDLAGERTGNVLTVAGGKLSIYKLVETPGRFKDTDSGLWTPEEIAEHWRALSKL